MMLKIKAALPVHQVLLISIAAALCCLTQIALADDDGFASACGSIKDVSSRIGACIKPIFAVVEGNLTRPSSDADLVSICDRFATSEKCIRGTARDCLTGIHKTTTSAVASSSRRFRSQECKSEESRAKYMDAALCSIKIKETTNEIKKVYQNHTAISQAIRDAPNLRWEEKLIKNCCIFPELDRELARVYDKECPKSTDNIIKIIHALTDDARSTVCVRPKCDGVLKPFIGLKPSKETTSGPHQLIIEPIMEVLFKLSNKGD